MTLGTLATLIPIAVSAPLVLSIVTFNGDGWVPYPLASNSIGTPYKDFFFPAPPFELWLGRFATLTSDPLLTMHAIGAIWVGIFSLSVFLIARKFTSNGMAFVGAMIGSATWMSNLFDRSGGWNQQYIAMLWLGTALLVEATDRFNSQEERRKGQLAHWPSLTFAALAGLSFAISALVKQSAIPSIVIVIAASALWTLFVGYRRLLEWVKWMFGGLAIGLGVPAVATLVWLTSIGALSGFLVAMSQNGGKNSTAIDQLGTISTDFSQVLSDPSALLVTTAFVVLCVLGLGQVSSRSILRPIVLIGGTALAYLAVVAYKGTTNWTLPLVLLIAAFLYVEMTEGVSIRVRLVLASAGVLASVAYAVAFHGGPGLLAAFTQFQGNNQNTFVDLGLGLVAAALFEAVRVAPHRNARFLHLGTTIAVPSSSQSVFQSSSISSRGTTSCAAALGFAATWGIAVIRPLSGPFVLGIWLSGGVALGVAWMIHVVRMSDLHLPKSISVMLVSWSLVASIGFVAGSYLVPYSWWGYQEPAFSLTRVQPTATYLRDFQLSPQSAAFYDNLTEIFSYLRERLPSSATMVTFPNIPMAVNLSGFEPLPMKCPVVWWDLCPDSYALESLNQVRAAKPDILVWAFPPWEAVRINEEAYRGGKRSILRKWLAWQREAVKDRQYTTIGSVEMPGEPPITGWIVGVYARTHSLRPTTAGTPPYVSYTSPPAYGPVDVSPDTTVRFTFSEAVNVTPASFSLRCLTTASTSTERILFRVSTATGSNTFVLTPEKALPLGGTCTATAVADKISSKSGKSLAFNDQLQFIVGS
jgi:hypothetical protein